jgi:hypothetical protein
MAFAFGGIVHITLRNHELHVHSNKNNNCPRPLEAFEDPHEESVVEGVQQDV